MKTSRSVLSASSLALVLLLAGCAGKELAGDAGLAEEHKPEPSHAGEVAMGALKGAGKGAAACAMPTAVGIYAGPIGLIVGGIITIYCLPFGIVAGDRGRWHKRGNSERPNRCVSGDPLMKLLVIPIWAALVTGCASGGGSGGSGPGSAAQAQPRAQSEPSPCGTLYGRPVECVPTQRAAIDAAMDRANRAACRRQSRTRHWACIPPPGAPRSSSTSTPAPTPALPGHGADSTGLGFEYQSFGAWNHRARHNSVPAISAWFAGQPTAALAVPTSGNARFTGNLVGIYGAAVRVASTARANVVLDANFSSRSLGFASSNTTLNGAAAPHLDLNGTLTYAVPGSGFAGTLRNADRDAERVRQRRVLRPARRRGRRHIQPQVRRCDRFTGAYGAKR